MATAKIIQSPHDKRRVTYVDPLKLTHTGFVVGQSPDGNWFYVQSSNPKAPPKAWHFKIAAEMINTVLVN